MGDLEKLIFRRAAQRYLPHTKTSGPSLASGLIPHETVVSVR
jgi:hypothetical protein